MKAMDKLNLYVVGTIFKNWLPKEVIINKSSKEFKEMVRGGSKQYVYKYTNNNQTRVKYGLVRGMDRDIVYCISSNKNNHEMGYCYRRSNKGIKLISCP
jgi:hypothetical protein